MERLTKRREDGTVMLAWECPEECEYSTCSMEEGITCGHECEAEVWCKLAYYEDLAEQDRLIELPCKIGDTLYFIENGEVFECVVYSFDIRPLQRFVRDYNGISLNFSKFNKTVFLTKSEAEAKLKELESEGK